MNPNKYNSSKKKPQPNQRVGALQSISGIPMVGYRNELSGLDRNIVGAYQAFRWWGIGTRRAERRNRGRSISGIPMVGYRNSVDLLSAHLAEHIRHSDGGVSELPCGNTPVEQRAYQAFRWWGIGTVARAGARARWSISGIPMVGYRNVWTLRTSAAIEHIRHSDGGVSEQRAGEVALVQRAYQAFRWWGIGTRESSSVG